MIGAFYAVTMTSVYRVYLENSLPAAVKISLRGESPCPVGRKLNQGKLLAITPSGLISCNETGDDFMPLDNTSALVALFLDEGKARLCSYCRNLLPLDKRWRKETGEVMRAIGLDHPVFPLRELVFPGVIPWE